jgi:hypothetical protein
MSDMKLGFELEKIELALEALLPIRKIKDPQNLKRYQAIVKSIREVGMIEPLMVYPQKDHPDTYVLLDGHLRCLALKQLGQKTAECLIAKDDECFTYNNRINRLPPIQCHKMIVKAVHAGVRPERIAEALDMPLSVVRGLITLLDGINEEAAHLLRDKNVSPKTIRLLKKVIGLRQIEIAELMVNANNYGVGYAEALVFATQPDQMVNPKEPKKKTSMTAEEAAKMEQEMESLEKDFKAVEAAYTENMMNLTMARTYIKSLLKNAKVIRYLSANHAEFLAEFEAIVAAETV